MFSRIVVLTPSLTGKDGISMVSRHVLNALSCEPVISAQIIECWSLGEDALSPPQGPGFGFRYRSAHGSKIRFTAWGLQAGACTHRNTLVLALHLHLAPVALPLMARGARLAIFVHGIEAWNRMRGLRRIALCRAWRVIGNSDYTVSRFLSANANCRVSDVRVCHLGISSQGPVPAPQRSVEPFALIVGRVAAEERYKGHDLLLEIWPKIITEFPAACLTIVGDGNDRPRLQMKASALGLSNKVKFLGKVCDEMLAGLYRDCAFFIMPSRKEGFGLVFLEAMRANKACIGAIGAASEVIVDGVTGLIVDPGKPDQVVREVLRLFRMPEFAARMGQAGALRFASHFTEEHFRASLRTSLALEPLPEQLSAMAGSACHL